MEQAQSSAAAAAAPQAGMAQIRFGVYNQPGMHAGKTVKDVRDTQGKLWGIPADASAYLGANKVDENYVIQPGDNLEFHRRAGEKG